MFCFLCFTWAVGNELYYTGDEPKKHQKVGQEIRPMNELSDKCIEDLPTHGNVGWGGGGRGKKIFHRDVIAMMVKARGDERGNACSFIRTLP